MSANEEEPSSENSQSYFKPSYVLIAVDTEEAMFIKDENSYSPFSNVMNACYEIANSLLFVKDKKSWSQFAVILANNDNEKSTFIDFKDNLLDTIKLLKEKRLLKNEDLANQYKRSGDFYLADFLLQCKKKFEAIKTDVFFKTLIYITNDDNPVKGDSNKRYTALNEAKNINDSNIRFQLISTIRDFNHNLFYNELFSIISPKLPIEEEICLDVEGLIAKLSSLIRPRFRKRKTYFYLSKNDLGRFLKVNIIDFITKVNLFNNAMMMRSTKTLVKKKYTSDDTEISDFTNRIEIKFGLLNTVTLSKDKLPQSNAPVGFHLVCVSNRISTIGFVLDESCPLLTVDPKEELSAHFNTLWQYCVEKNKVLICGRKCTRVGRISYEELIPKYVNNTKMFLIRTIPAFNHTQIAPVMKIEESLLSSTQKDVIDKLIDKLSFSYHPQMLPNMSYDLKARYVKAKLLDEKIDDDDVVEVTDNDTIDERIKDIILELKNEFNFKEDDSGKFKRKATASNAGQSKRTKK